MPQAPKNMPKSQQSSLIPFKDKTQPQSPASSLGHVKSLMNLENNLVNQPKKYKKGYLHYEDNGNTIWQIINNKRSKITRPKQQITTLTAKIFMAIDLNSY